MNELQLKDFLQYRFLSAIEHSPNGQKGAFVVSNANEEENSYESRLYLYDGEIRPLTALGKESSFLWLDDNRLLFPAVRSAKEKKRAEKHEAFTSYHVLDLRGGEAQPAFTLPFGAHMIRRLDDTHFAVLGGMDANQPDYYRMSDEEREQVHKAYADEKDYEVFDEIPFWFNGRGVINKRRTALFMVTTDPWKVERITEPMTMVHSMLIYGDEVLFDSETFCAKPSLQGCCIRALNWRTGEMRDVMKHEKLSLSQMIEVDHEVWLLGTTGERHGMNENDWVYRLDVHNGALDVIRQEEYSLYGSVGSDCRLGGGRERMAKGEWLYAVTTREGNASLCRIDRNGGMEMVLTGDGSVDCFSVSEGSDQALVIGLFGMKLQELYACNLKTGTLTQLSHFNDEVLRDTYVAQPVPLSVESEGLTIGGWVLPPRDFDPQKTYPAVLDIHGGPKTVYGPVFYHEMQLWANMGYFVFYCNPKGGDGRDNAFMDIRGHYGETDYQNLMDFTDAVLRAYPQIDPKRVCETGGSYGGFMTNWIIGHTDRFCCAASQRSISNWLSFYGVSDIGFTFAEDQNAGNPFESPEKLWQHSPLKYAANAVTPTLFIHSDEDYRCPLAEGLQMYTALVDRGVPARLCVFHGENHELSRSGKPSHRVRRLKEITDWFERYAR
ncbi:MAG: S9 family peptidase [bacterium]|nr:S9 family peptidase [bacterium]